jgi:uncharacterized small protein (DUF1192 family)
MRRHRAFRTATAAALLGLALAGRSVAADEGGPPTIYKWVDENGIAHYTTNKKRIPSNLRNRIRSVDEVKREQQQARGIVPETPAIDAGRGDFVEGDASLPAREPGEGSAGPVAAPVAPAAPTAPAAPPPAAPVLPPGGPPEGTDIYAVRDAGDDFGTSVRDDETPGVGEPLFEDEPSEGQSVDPNAAARIRELDGRIATLEAELAKDEQRLKELISGARMEQGKPAPLYGVPELEELAHRFPKIQAEIAALRAERRALEPVR